MLGLLGDRIGGSLKRISTKLKKVDDLVRLKRYVLLASGVTTLREFEAEL